MANWKLGVDEDPIQICGYALGRLSMIWDDWAERTGTGYDEFLPNILANVWDDENTGEEYEHELDNWERQPPEMQPFALIQALMVCTGYACQGMKAQKAGNMKLAWNYATRCNYWLGIVAGAWSIRKEDGVRPSLARLGADARHAENRAIKDFVMKWLDENKTTALNGEDAADEIAGKVAPIKRRTARDYITEWKKLRSAGTP